MIDFDSIWRTQDEIRTVVNAVLGECIWNLAYAERRSALTVLLSSAFLRRRQAHMLKYHIWMNIGYDLSEMLKAAGLITRINPYLEADVDTVLNHEKI